MCWESQNYSLPSALPITCTCSSSRDCWSLERDTRVTASRTVPSCVQAQGRNSYRLPCCWVHSRSSINPLYVSENKNTREHQLPEEEAEPSTSVLKTQWSSTNSWASENSHSWVKRLISNCEVQLYQMWLPRW